MQKLKKYFKLLLVLSMFLSLPLFAKKALMPIIMDDIVVMVSYTIPKPSKPVPFPYKGRVKKTGQIKSYDYYGNVVTDGSFKDDGYYQKGITPKYSRVNDIVTDHITGLQWQDNTDILNYDYIHWSDAKSYCNNLSLGGGGWRLPTVIELQSILLGFDIDTTVFVNVKEYDNYWSSTEVKGASNHMWVVAAHGGTYLLKKGHVRGVRCVR